MIERCRIRAFKQDDLPELHKIREAAFAPVFKSFRSLVGDNIAPIALATAESEQADYLDEISKEGSAHDLFVVELDARLIGFVSVKCDEKTKVGEIDLNAVHPDHQGVGVGSLMFDFALDHLRNAGMRVATVGTGGDDSHAPARRAYENAGFTHAIPSVYLYKTL